MTTPNNSEPDWSLTTWKGSRRKQHQDFHAIPFARKLEIIEEMNSQSRAMVENRRIQGLPYIDPYSGERVPGSAARADAPNEKSSPGNS